MSNNAQPPTGAEEVTWDLSHLYAGVDDSAIDRDLDEADARADELAQTYRGRVAELSVDEMRDLLEEYESLSELVSGHGRLGQRRLAAKGH